jgi:hypothetical protein
MRPFPPPLSGLGHREASNALLPSYTLNPLLGAAVPRVPLASGLAKTIEWFAADLLLSAEPSERRGKRPNGRAAPAGLEPDGLGLR